jgi:hypothetical protein
VRVEGPDDGLLHATDAERLFPDDSTITRAQRRRRLEACPRVVATAGGRVVGLAICRQVDREMRALDFAISLPAPRVVRDDGVTMLRVFHAMLDVIEVASTAGGCDHILVCPPRVPGGTLERRGYVAVDDADAGLCWRRCLWVAHSSRRKSGGRESASS